MVQYPVVKAEPGTASAPPGLCGGHPPLIDAGGRGVLWPHLWGGNIQQKARASAHEHVIASQCAHWRGNLL